MSSKIYVASKPVAGGAAAGYDHLYLVYDGDGDSSTTTDQKVVRGGPNGIGQAAANDNIPFNL